MRTKPWVTAFFKHNSVVVKVGEQERIIYQAQPGDLIIGDPIVSWDGKKLAFTKTEWVPDDSGVTPPFDLTSRPFTAREWEEWKLGDWEVRKRAEKIYTLEVDGSHLTAVAELARPRNLLIMGVYSALQLAWSHDNSKIVYVERLKGGGAGGVPSVPRPEQYPQRLGGLGPFTEGVVKLLDVPSRQSVVLLASVRRPLGFSIITSQAWSSDNRRLVYVNELSHVIVFDTVTREGEDFGEGEEPTWSPDGQFITFKEPWEIDTERAKKTDGDYILVSADPLRQRTILLANNRPFWKSSLRSIVGYYGPALWSPDSRFLLVRHMNGLLSEVGDWHVLNRTTKEIKEYPPSIGWGRSWGGTP